MRRVKVTAIKKWGDRLLKNEAKKRKDGLES
jgi:hypothetical protein